MSNLHEELVKLGTTNPELRPHIRPLLATGTQKTATAIALYDFSSLLASWNLAVAEGVVKAMGLEAISSSGGGPQGTEAHVEFRQDGSPDTRWWIRVMTSFENPCSVKCAIMALNDPNPEAEISLKLERIVNATPARLSRALATKLRKYLG